MREIWGLKELLEFVSSFSGCINACRCYGQLGLRIGFSGGERGGIWEQMGVNFGLGTISGFF